MKSLTEDPDAELLIDAMPSNRSRRIASCSWSRTSAPQPNARLSSEVATRSRSNRPSRTTDTMPPKTNHRHRTGRSDARNVVIMSRWR